MLLLAGKPRMYFYPIKKLGTPKLVNNQQQQQQPYQQQVPNKRQKTN